jgi:hypothetical protein
VEEEEEEEDNEGVESEGDSGSNGGEVQTFTAGWKGHGFLYL